jgi:allophanate hydrolase subunit 2
MSEKLFDIRGGLSFDVSQRIYGQQDRGISPGGAQDQLSFNVAYNLLEKPAYFKAIEMLYPAKIITNQDLLVVISGASYQTTKTNLQNITYNQVYKLHQNEVLEFSGVKKGFRTIVLAVPMSEANKHLIGNKRSKQLEQFINLNYRDNFIRVIKGPEYHILNDSTFFDSDWWILQNSSQMGLSLDGPCLDFQKIQMISQPVADGTIQLSPSGPIVLMRHRQTVGGYPRIANVIELDISKASQFSPGSKIKFKLIDLNETIEIGQKLSEFI